MSNIIDKFISFLIRLTPQDFLLPTRFFLAKAILLSFIGGFVFSYFFNFLVKKAYKGLRSFLKEKRRNKRLAAVKVPNGEFIGEVTQFLNDLKVAVVKIKNKELRVGDTILIKGNQTKLILPVKSLQLDRQPVEIVKKGKEAGLLIGKKVSRNDLVFKIKR